MDNPQSPQAFNTLHGFLNGEEEHEKIYFCFRATLRIYGDGVPFDEISQRLGIQPTNTHRKGERRHANPNHSYQDDAWHFESPLSELEPLEHHLAALWLIIKPEVEYLKLLKRNFNVDVFCGYRTNCDHAGFEISHKALELFTALEIPFGVSIIVA
jgi:hypothetical protein